MTKFDTYQDVTNAIVAQLEAGAKPWRQGWSGGGIATPRRANGVPYRGINVLLLWISAMEHGHSHDHWLTFKQAIDLGGAVRKGEKGTRIVFFKSLEIAGKGDGEGGSEGGEDKARRVPLLRSYTVFNASQCDGLPARFQPSPVELVGGKVRDDAAESALRACGADIREGEASAYYVPSADYINLPAFAAFHSTGDYLATMAHELCHWTGHKSRLGRNLLNSFGSKDYAQEELIAEIGAAFIGARLGIVGDHLDNHAAYLASWLKALKEDKRAIFRAASAAQAAADFVLGEAASTAAEPEAAAA